MISNILTMTPIVPIRYKYKGNEGCIYAKLEYYNPSGSIKDRVAHYICKKAIEKSQLKEKQPIVETTSGNTGIAFAAYGAMTGHPVHIFMPDWASEERKNLMLMYGAQLHLISREEGGFKGCLKKAITCAEEIGAYQPLQFKNPDNSNAHYYTTAQEILMQVPDVTDFVSGVGSGGTIMGNGRRLKEARNARITAIEPDTMALLSGEEIKGPHRIEGIGDDFIPYIVDRSVIDKVHKINDADAIIMAARLAKEIGLGVGISSGANFLGAVLQSSEDPKNRVVVTIFADDNKKYITTDLSNPPEMTPGMISSQIELLGIASS